MEQRSLEVKAIKCLINDLLEQEGKQILANPLKDQNKFIPEPKKDKFELEFPRTLIFQLN